MLLLITAFQWVRFGRCECKRERGEGVCQTKLGSMGIEPMKHLGQVFFTTQGSRFLRLGHRAGQPTFPIPVVSSIRLPAGFGYSYPLPRNSWSHKLFAWFLTSHSQECLSGRCAGLAFPSYNNEGYFGMGQDTLLKHLANSPNHSVPSPNE
jgi:hypothetical protein